MRIASTALVIIAGLMALLIGVAGFAADGGWGIDGANAAARLTARWSFVWFLTAWTASSLAALRPGGWRRDLLRRRRAIGLSFAAAHFVHAGFFLLAILVFRVEPPLPTLIGGGTGYLFVALMAATSNDAALRRLGPRLWRMLHATGGWIVLFIFALTYAGRIAEHPGLGIPATALIAAALALRIAAWLKTRQAMA